MLNVELRNETVRPHLRDDVGIMVLPVCRAYRIPSELKNAYFPDQLAPQPHI
jgi:hypothetical protein